MSSSTPSSSKDIVSNPRGIPAAPFIADVQEHVGGPDGNVENTLRKFEEMSAKYRYMELNLQQRKRGLEEKIPDIRKTLSVVQHLKARQDKKTGKAPAGDEDDLEDDLEDEDDEKKDQPIKTLFELNETLYAEAQVEETGEVYLWLGANTMLSYPLAEAVELLTTKLEAAELSLSNNVEDAEFLKEQITVMEVNTARVYNWDVKRRRERKALEEDAEGGQEE